MEKTILRILRYMLTIIWILDILDMPYMNFLDTTIPINTFEWFLIWSSFSPLEDDD